MPAKQIYPISNFGKWILNYKQKYHISVAEIARRIGLSRSSLGEAMYSAPHNLSRLMFNELVNLPYLEKEEKEALFKIFIEERIKRVFDRDFKYLDKEGVIDVIAHSKRLREA